MTKHWRIANYDSAVVSDLAQSASIPQLVAQLLIGRGVCTPQAARQFLDTKLTDLRNPNELPGVDPAAEVVFAAIRDKKQIVVYGDYDADGMTATAILIRCLRLLGANCRFYVPHRLDEGYGLNCNALDDLSDTGADLVITVDNGIASVREADYAKSLGIELVVTDHHQFGSELPQAAALVHPQLPGTEYPFAGLCGAAVAFKLAWALCQLASGSDRVKPAMRDFLLQATGLCAIGTVADVVPLVDENRAIVRHGLTILTSNPVPGIAALKQLTELDKKPALMGDDIAFTLAPRLNAAGRLGQAELGIELLTTDEPQRASELADFINELNSERQTLERSVLLAARKQAKHRFDPKQDSALVLADHGWHAGVIGIVAGKLAEQYHRPVVLISQDKLGIKPGMGSGRSIPGFDLHHAFSKCTDQLVSHGGHAAAAGLRIQDAMIDDFRRSFCDVAASQIPAEQRTGQIEIDAEVAFASLTRQTIEQVDSLAPFGCGNRRPTLCSNGVNLLGEPRTIGATGRHLSMDFEQHGVRLRAVAFGGSDWNDDLKSTGNQPLSIAFHPVLNHFRGRVSVELHLADWKTA